MGIQKQSIGEFFVGQGDLFYFDEITDYTNKTLANLTGPKSFGNIKEGSTNWTGDDITVDVIKNEQGKPISSVSTSGTYAFEAVMAEMDKDTLIRQLKGLNITLPSTLDWISVTDASAVGFGVDLSVIVRPVALANDVLNKTLIFPKAKITSALTIEDKMFCIKMSINAEALDMDGLKTCMVLYGALQYEE